MHYGVKGMKLGVRKAYEPVGDHQRRAPVEKARVGESTRIVRKLNARHIYEKQGFVAGKQISSEDDVWGGLTKMKKKLRD